MRAAVAAHIAATLFVAALGAAHATEGLDSARAGFAQAMAARDLEGIARHFDEQGILVMRDGSEARGHGAIKEGFRSILADERFRIRSVPESSSTIRNGDIILRSGRWQLLDADGKVHEEWFASEVWRKNADGQWVYLIDNPYHRLPG